MASSYFGNMEWDVVGSLDTSGTNTVDYIPGSPIDVKRIMLVVTTAMTAADCILTIGKRDADLGTNSSDYATVTVPFASGADGAQFIIDFAVPTAAVSVGADGPFTDQYNHAAVVYSSRPGLLHIDFGQELFVTSNGGGDAGVSTVYVEYLKQGLNDSMAPDAVRLTATAA